MGKDVIIACDFPGKDETISFLNKFSESRPFVKIGMELYYAEGPDIVRTLKERGHKVFLDLKLHDIPNTVKSAMKVLSLLGADMVNVHAGGMRAMMEAAREGLGPDGLLIAVTMLTSTSEADMGDQLLISRPLEETVLRYAENARLAGLDGVVCSPNEAPAVHDYCGKGFLTVTPGVRFDSGGVDDQKRVATPAAARVLGSDYIVVGRPITRALDPLEAYRRCVSDFVDS